MVKYQYSDLSIASTMYHLDIKPAVRGIPIKPSERMIKFPITSGYFFPNPHKSSSLIF